MFEKVNPSHPDKLADRIAGALVDYAYAKEHDPRIAAEVLLGHGKCHIISSAPTVPALPAVSAATSVVKITEDSAPGIRTAALILYGGARLPQSAPVPASKKKR